MSLSRRIVRRVKALVQPPVEVGPVELERRVDAWVDSVLDDRPKPTLAEPISQACTWAQFAEPVYATWLERFGEPAIANRKVWEWAWICQLLDLHVVPTESDAPRDVVGFGVGTEPIVGWMAHRGHRVLATDLPPDDEQAARWASTNQLAADITELDPRGLATQEEMADRVRFRAVDMRDVPEDLGDFDALWSSCAIEHLGSLEAGFDFVRTTLRHCRPGAISLHTTELNVSHDDHTVSSGHTVVYRRRDLEMFFEEMRSLGHHVEATFHMGDAAEDRQVDHPPFSEIHMKVPVDSVVTTSFGIAIRVAG